MEPRQKAFQQLKNNLNLNQSLSKIAVQGKISLNDLKELIALLQEYDPKKIVGITELELNDCGLQPEWKDQIVELIKLLPNLTVLTIASNQNLGGDKQNNQEFWQALSKVSSGQLTTLNLASNAITTKNLEKFSPFFAGKKSLKTIDFSGNMGGYQLLYWLDQNQINDLDKINIANCRLLSDAMFGINIASLTGFKITDLILSDNPLLKSLQRSKLEEFLSHNQISKVEIKKCGFDENEIDASLYKPQLIFVKQEEEKDMRINYRLKLHM